MHHWLRFKGGRGCVLGEGGEVWVRGAGGGEQVGRLDHLHTPRKPPPVTPTARQSSNRQPARADRSGHKARAWAQARGRARGVRPHVVGGRDELEVEPGVGNAVLLRAPLLRKVRAVMRLHDRAAVAHDGIRSALRSAAPAQHAQSQAVTHTAGERRPPTRSPHPLGLTGSGRSDTGSKGGER